MNKLWSRRGIKWKGREGKVVILGGVIIGDCCHEKGERGDR
jgi:hypothetical protein